MKFKKYLYGKCRHICSLKRDSFAIMETIGISGEEFNLDEFWQMHVSFVAEPSSKEDEPCLTFAYDRDMNSYLFTRKTIPVITGKLAGWMPVDICVGFECIVFACFNFEDGEENVDAGDVCAATLFQLPVNAKIKVDIDMGDHRETFVVSNRAASNEDAVKYVIEEYEDGVLQRTCELGKDEDGVFELVTEA